MLSDDAVALAAKATAVAQEVAAFVANETDTTVVATAIATTNTALDNIRASIKSVPVTPTTGQ